MKLTLTALASGFFGAALVLIIQTWEPQLIKPAQAAPISKKVLQCYLAKMDKAHTKYSSGLLHGWCNKYN